MNSFVLLHVSFPLKLFITSHVSAGETIGSVQLLGLEVDHQMSPELPGPVPDLWTLWTWELLLRGILFGNL